MLICVYVYIILQILFPALVLHGTFDYVLFILGAVGYAYDLPDIGVEIASVVFGINVTIAGIVYATRAFKRVETEFREGWRIMPGDEDQVRNPIIYTDV